MLVRSSNGDPTGPVSGSSAVLAPVGDAFASVRDVGSDSTVIKDRAHGDGVVAAIEMGLLDLDFEPAGIDRVEGVFDQLLIVDVRGSDDPADRDPGGFCGQRPFPPGFAAVHMRRAGAGAAHRGFVLAAIDGDLIEP